MQLLTIDDVPGGSPAARLRSGKILHLGRAARPETAEAWLPSSVLAILEGGAEALGIVRRVVERAETGGAEDELTAARALLAADAPLLAPIPAPRMILATGMSYKAHLAEMAGTPSPPHPTAFMKSPASVAAPGAALQLPRQASEQVDYEGEFACVFGRTCHMVERGEALRYVAGYTIANDLSARDWVRDAWASTEPWDARLTWEVNLRGKQLPGFTPVGPALVTPDEISDLDALRLRTFVNGKQVQDTLIGDLIFPVDELIAHLSRWYQFRPGDVLLTGTPAGCGVGRKPPTFLRGGDLVQVTIDGFGELSTPVLAPLGTLRENRPLEAVA